jgi:hypothetical protein
VASQTPPQPPQMADPTSNCEEPSPASGEKLTTEAISGDSAVAAVAEVAGGADATAPAPSTAETGPSAPGPVTSGQESCPGPREKLTTEAILVEEAPGPEAPGVNELSPSAESVVVPERSGIEMLFPDARRSAMPGHDQGTGVVHSPPEVSVG